MRIVKEKLMVPFFSDEYELLGIKKDMSVFEAQTLVRKKLDFEARGSIRTNPKLKELREKIKNISSNEKLDELLKVLN